MSPTGFHPETWKPEVGRREVAARRREVAMDVVGTGLNRSGRSSGKAVERAMRYELRFGLLGPPVLYDADGEVRSIGGGKVRALLVALLLEPGRVVSVDALKDALWGGAPPASAQASLQNHVTRLRRLLDDPERLRAMPPGYLLRVDEGELDVRVCSSWSGGTRPNCGLRGREPGVAVPVVRARVPMAPGEPGMLGSAGFSGTSGAPPTQKQRKPPTPPMTSAPLATPQSSALPRPPVPP
jgi:hypothetical protein